MTSRLIHRVLVVILLAVVAAPVLAEQDDHAHEFEPQRSITDTSLDLPTWEEFTRVVLLKDHNTRVIVIGTTLLGAAAGIIGTFLLLRKRALMGDAAP